MTRLVSLSVIILSMLAFSGCKEEPASIPSDHAESEAPDAARGEPVSAAKHASGQPGQTPAEEPAARPKAAVTTEGELKAALKEKNPGFAGQLGSNGDGRNILAVAVNDPAVSDISPLAGLPLMMLDLKGCHVTDIGHLRGMPLQELFLEDTGVSDISVLKGMPLVKLYLSNTQVSDLSPLTGSPLLQELNLVGTPVSDIGPLRGMRGLKMLWLTGCPVRDLGALQEVPSLISLTVAETKVSDLSPLKGHGLQRLHIAKTEVTDLSPLQWMRLTRLIFTPNRIKTGIEFARQMNTLTQIDVRFDETYNRPMSPAQFWPLYEAGEFK